MTKTSSLIKIGTRFGRLVVLGVAEGYGKDSSYYKVKCDCGCIFVTRKTSLEYGFTKSCGCLRVELLKKRMKDMPDKFNKSRKTFVKWKGDTHCIPEWSRITGTPLPRLYYLYYKYNGDAEKIFCYKPRKSNAKK